MKRSVTIHDIAKSLNIDSSTVSRALNGSLRVGEKTKNKVRQKAKEMGYQRNLLASSLRASKTMTLGVVVPFISRNFFAEAIDSIEQVASSKGFRVIISQTHDSLDVEKEIVKGFFMNRVDGILISPTQSTRNDEHLKIFIDNNIPVVLFDRFYKKSCISKVILDDKKATFNLTEHIIKHGRKNIFYITGNLKSAMYQERFCGYKEALKKHNINIDNSLVKSIDLYPKNAIDVLKEILSNHKNIPDAILCANDVTALAMMKYIEENTNMKVPDDIAIAGFSNELASSVIKPGLTTVNQNSHKIGEESCKMLLNFIENKKDVFPEKEIIIKSELIIRGSTA